jgi:hypothetical protein
MKAVLALIIIYVGTFLIVQQGTQDVAAQNTPATASQGVAKSNPTAMDPAKEADIRSLIELVGTRDLIDDAADKSGAQYSEKIRILMPDKDRAQKLSEAFMARYKARFNSDEMAEELVRIYDKHFTADEIKGLLQFYGSPLGQKFAVEMPALMQEAQASGAAVSQRAAKDAWQDMRAQNPDLGSSQRASRRP